MTTKNRRPGRPKGSVADPANKKKRINITLTNEHHQLAALAGEGNVSAGVAIALDVWAKLQKKK